jgi:hypothetical protein
MKLKLISAALAATTLFGQPVKADELETAMILRSYSTQCKDFQPLPSKLDKAALTTLWGATNDKSQMDRAVAIFIKISKNQDLMGNDAWCAATASSIFK